MSILTIAEVKLRLNKSLTVDDAELQSMLDAAEARYAEVVGPVGTTTRDYYGSLPPKDATDVIYRDANGVEVETTGWPTQGSPYLYWNEPLGIMGHGLYSTGLTITYTTTIPAHHREAILADVAGYFAATQRGGGTVAPRFPGEGYAEPYDGAVGPVVLFPRIEALVSSTTSVA